MRVLERHQASLSRRSFLMAGAAVGGGLIVGWMPAGCGSESNAAQPFDVFIRIDPAGKVTVISPSIEMGQGTYTSLPMLVAEELDVDMKNVAVDHSPPNNKLYGNPALFG